MWDQQTESWWQQYRQNPYGGCDRVDNPPFLFDGDLDGRLAPKDRVVEVAYQVKI